MGTATNPGICPRCGMSAAARADRCARCGTELPRSDAELVLVGTSAEIADQRWVVASDAAIIGRAPTADVRVDHRSVSRSHARIVRQGDSFFIEDAGGQNGTFVNGERIVARTALGETTRIGLGHVELAATIVGQRRIVAAREAAAMSTTVVAISDVLDSDLSERETKAFSVPSAPELDGDTRLPVEAGPEPEAIDAEEPVVDLDLDISTDIAATETDEFTSETEADLLVAAPTYGLDALTTAVAEFARTFDEVHAALLRFRESYAAFGGREAAIDVAAHAAVVQEDPEQLAALLALGQQAERIRQMAEAIVDLGMTLGPASGDPSQEG